jgi:hypothetical protein
MTQERWKKCPKAADNLQKKVFTHTHTAKTHAQKAREKRRGGDKQITIRSKIRAIFTDVRGVLIVLCASNAVTRTGSKGHVGNMAKGCGHHGKSTKKDAL